MLGASGFDLGNAYGKVVIDVSGVSAAMDQASAAINNGLAGLGDKFASVGNNMASIGTSLIGLTAPIAAAGAAGLKSAADFDTLMKQIEIFGGVTGDELQKVGDYALQMGADTKFSSTEAAASMLELMKSGMSLEQTMATLPTVLDLAAAGEIGLAQAAGIVSSGLSIFKLKGEDAARVSDALAKAANASRANIADLGQGFVTVGPVAAMYGLTVEDTAAALGVLADNGILGAEAGTQLKTVLTNIHRPTKDVTDALTKLNVSLYNTDGTARNFDDIIKDLDASLDALPINEQNELMTALGGSYGIVGLGALRAAGGISDMMGEMDKAPAAKTLAEAFMNTFSGKVESLTGSIDTLLVSALTPFMNEVLVPMVARITDVVNAITAWTRENPELTSQIVKVLAVLVTLGPALFIIGKAITLVGGILTGFSGLFGVLFSTILPIIAVVGLLYLAWESNFLGIRDIVEPIIANIVIGIETLVGVISNFGSIVENQGIGTAIASVINAFAQMAGIVGNDEMAQGAMDMGNGIVTAFQSVVTFVQTYVLPVFETLADWFLNSALPAIVNFVVTAVVPALQSFFNFLGQLWEIVGPHLENLYNWFVTEALPAILNFISTVVIPVIGSFITTLTDIWNVVAPVLLQLLDWFLNTGLPEIQRLIGEFIINIWEPLVATLSGIWDSVSAGLGNIVNFFTTTGIPFINAAIDYLKVTYLDPLIATLKSIWDVVKVPLESVVNFIRDTFGPVINGIVDGVVGFINKIPEAIQGAITEIIRLVDSVINNPIIQSINPAFAAMVPIWNQSKGALTATGAQGGGASFHDFAGAYDMSKSFAVGTGAQPELFMPGNANGSGMAIPNIDKVLNELVSGDKGMVFEAGSVVINANSYAEGVSAAEGFETRIQQLRDSRGGG